MPTVFEYTDYRTYLADCYSEKKADNSRYSYQVLADKAGFKDKSCIYSVVKGRRPLSTQGAFKVSQALKHSRLEAEYFENLVLFNQATTLNERSHYFDRLCQIKARTKGVSSTAQLLHKEQYEYYAKWYNLVVRELVTLPEFQGDYTWLAKKVFPAITPAQANRSVELLLKLGLIKKKGKRYVRASAVVATPPEVTSVAVANFHRSMGERAIAAIDQIPREQRNITASTVNISEQGFEQIKKVIEDCRKTILSIAEADEPADRVYQLNVQFFPVSALDRKSSKR